MGSTDVKLEIANNLDSHYRLLPRGPCLPGKNTILS